MGDSVVPIEPPTAQLEKAPTGITGFDEVSSGGLPRGRCTLVSGAAGSGKTIFGLEFLVQGALKYGETGVLMSFEESSLNLRQDVSSLGFNLQELVDNKQLVLESCRINRSEVVTIGSFDLEGLFLRLENAIGAVGAQRVVIDPIETLLSTYGDTPIVRGELLHLCDWLNERGLTSVMIGERGRQGELTRFGVEEYVSDCVILLDQRVEHEIGTRRLRVVKYRGSAHGTNEFPFTITSKGFVVLPITSVKLSYSAGSERISTGLGDLDQMLGGGLYRHSSVLISGHTGTGKTTLIAKMLCEAARRGERCLFVSSEESPDQLVRDMSSVSIDLQHWLDLGLLKIWSERSTSQGMEERLVRLEHLIEEFQPRMVALDTIRTMGQVAQSLAVNTTIVRTLDLLRSRGITALLSILTHPDLKHGGVIGISEIIDTWLLVKNVEADGENNRLLMIVKSRGSAHSNQVREFRLTSQGPALLEVRVSPEGIRTGSSRLAYEDKLKRENISKQNEIQRKHRLLERHRQEIEAQIELLSHQILDDSTELALITTEEQDAMDQGASQDLLRALHRGESND